VTENRTGNESWNYRRRFVMVGPIMRLTFRFLLMLVPALAIVTIGFVAVIAQLEQKRIIADLDRGAQIVSDSLRHPVTEALEAKRYAQVERITRTVSRDLRVWGILVCGLDGKLLSIPRVREDKMTCPDPKTFDKASTRLMAWYGETLHQAIYPLIDDNNRALGAIVVLQSLDISKQYSSWLTRSYALLAFFVLALIVAVVTVLLYRWSASRKVEILSKAVRGLLKGDVSHLSTALKNPEFAPFATDLTKVLQELVKRKRAPTLSAEENLFTATRLNQEIRRLYGDSRICVVANREPYVHNRKGKKIETLFPASGLVTAVEPIVRACSGVWIGHGSGSADRETADAQGRILVPPEHPEYLLKRVWLTREEENGYYYGFANEGLWPLCHIAHNRPTFREEDWKHYVTANQKFASAFFSEMTERAPIALIQDYHFALLPALIRERRPDAITSLFWHVPWPNPEAIRICPWKAELIKGMLGADLIGFHIQQHCNNFLDAVDHFLEARVDRANFTVTMQGHTCLVKPFPISIEWPPKYDATVEEIAATRSALLEELAVPQDMLIGVGVDRMDYTKGIGERLLAVERMLEKNPELVGKFVFIQISAPSRTHIPRYQQLDLEVRELALRINTRFHRPGYEPIMLRIAHHDAAEVFRFYRAADVCLVTSLHDGMNLVAKEYVAARRDLGGALVISDFTGAARELTDAFIVNPYDIEQTADALYKALTQTEEEGKQRMAHMRTIISEHNVYDWAAQFLTEVHRISESKHLATGTA